MSIEKLVSAALAVVTLTVAASVLSVPEQAAAHTPEVSANCSTLSVNLTDYDLDPYGASVNRVVVTVDSVIVADTRFGESFAATYALGDETRPHTYTVVVDAFSGPYDFSVTDSSTPCAPPVATDASAAVSLSAASCSAAETLVLGTPVFATWGTPSALTGPASYSVTATADPGHAFSDGTTTLTLTGTLAGAMDPAAAPCVTVVVPERPLPITDVSELTSLNCAAMTRTTTTTTSTTDWVLDTAANTWVAAPAVVSASTVTIAVEPAEATGVAGGADHS
jgi:hypothetical protein